MESTHTEKVSEATPISAKTPTFQEGAIPSATQIEVASPTTPLFISTSDPFAALSQAVKDGSSLVVTPSSIPSSAIRGPDADLSSEGSKDVLEDPNDEPIIKKRISKSDEEESVDSETEFIGMCLFLLFLLSFLLPFFCYLFFIYILVSPSCCSFPLLTIFILLIVETFKEPEVAADTRMPIATSPATPTTLVSAIPTSPVSTIPVSVTVTAPVFAILMTPIFTSLGEFSHLLPHFFLVSSLLLDHDFSYYVSCSLLGLLPTVPSEFDVGISFAMIPDPVSEAATFFTHFDQPEVNDLDPANFWGSCLPYMDFHGFRVPQDCVSHLEAIYSS